MSVGADAHGFVASRRTCAELPWAHSEAANSSNVGRAIPCESRVGPLLDELPARRLRYRGQHIQSKNTRAGEGAIRFLAHLFSRRECVVAVADVNPPQQNGPGFCLCDFAATRASQTRTLGAPSNRCRRANRNVLRAHFPLDAIKRRRLLGH